MHNTWEALAVGDCCVFHERDHSLRCAFPIDDPEKFGNGPILVPSCPQQYESIVPNILIERGTWEPGARLTLMSDAIAAWYLRERTLRSSSYLVFTSAVWDRDSEGLTQLIGDERAGKRMRNDDVAILRVYRPSPARG